MSESDYACVRCLFGWMNLLLWISGCGILGVGIWLRVAYEGYTTLLPEYALLSADSLAIAVGAITFVLSLCGFCGSWCESRCLLVMYFSLVVILFVVEFIVGSLAFIFRKRLNHILIDELQDGIWHHYNVTAIGSNSLVTIWDNIQADFKCCGVVDYKDWHLIDAWPHMRWVPDSCCLPNIAYKYCGRSEEPVDFHIPGCYNQIHMWFVQRLHIVGVGGLIVAFIQLFGLISAMLLFCTERHKRTSRTYRSYQKR